LDVDGVGFMFRSADPDVTPRRMPPVGRINYDPGFATFQPHSSLPIRLLLTEYLALKMPGTREISCDLKGSYEPNRDWRGSFEPASATSTFRVRIHTDREALLAAMSDCRSRLNGADELQKGAALRELLSVSWNPEAMAVIEEHLNAEADSDFVDLALFGLARWAATAGECRDALRRLGESPHLQPRSRDLAARLAAPLQSNSRQQ
jgi:hypothetical protein